MVSYTNKSNLTIENKTFDKEKVTLKNCRNVVIRNCDFSYNKKEEYMLLLENCKNTTVEKSKFHDKSTKGASFKVKGENTANITITDNEFYDMTFDDDNGGEPLQIGLSEFSGCRFNVIIRNNYFHDCSADVETVSIKSVGVLVENNRHEDNTSSIVVRHGGFATIKGNRFKGEGGIRLYGYGNIVTGNFFKDNRSTKFPPISLGAGTHTKDPNWITYSKPSGKKGKGHAAYAQLRKNTITNNTFENCKKQIYTRTDKPLKPRDNIINNNNEGNFIPLPTPPPEPTPATT